MSAVREHWERLAAEHGSRLMATTMTATIKRLEVDALARAFRAGGIDETSEATVLEVGCGNGHNLRMLSAMFPGVQFTGIDYVGGMVAAARELTDRVRFEVGDVLELNERFGRFDVVFTDRLLINLASHEQQARALDRLHGVADGDVVLIENTRQAYEQQNRLREAAGLPARTPPFHNLLVDESRFLNHASRDFEVVSVEEFAGLHDLILYVLGPAANGGTVDYEDSLVSAATELLLACPDAGAVRGAGQNRLFHLRKR